MGYRSLVAVVLSKNAIDAFNCKLKKQPVELQESVNDVFQSADIHHIDGSGAEMFLWQDVKWYDFTDKLYVESKETTEKLLAPYADITFISRTIKELNGDSYYYIRIGENVEDTEVCGVFWDNPFNLYLLRDIRYNAPDSAEDKVAIPQHVIDQKDGQYIKQKNWFVRAITSAINNVKHAIGVPHV